MSDVATPHLAHNGAAGTLYVYVRQVLGRLRAAAGQKTLDRYLVACAAVQFWADLYDSRESNGVALITTTGQMKEELRRAEREADHAAQALLGQVTVPAMTDDPALACVSFCKHSSPASLSKVLHLPMPECCGYDLADLELVAGDGKRLIERVGIDRPMLIVGIRTGGTYLAPLWKAVLSRLGVEHAHWHTVRLRSETQAFDTLTTLRALTERQPAPVVVVVDDQPDTGATMERVAALLRTPGIDLWFATVGKLWRGPAGSPPPSYTPGPLVCNRHHPRLWECLLASEHAKFIERLRGTPGLPAIPDHAQLQFRCPEGEVRYGLSRVWLPWNDPRVLNGRRPLINPRKTPVTVCGSDGRALLHLRFVGEGVFGRAESQRVQEMGGMRPAWFIDGYAVTADIGPARPFRERFHVGNPSAQANLLAQAANWLNVLAQQVIAQVHNNALLMRLGPRWAAVAAAMRKHCGSLSEVPTQLDALLARPVPWLGLTGRAIRSSLRYACGDWHWQIDEQGRLHRFQLEANWGDVSFPELELAAFVLENRIAFADARRLASLCGLAYSSVQQSLPLAGLMIAEARVRSVRILSDRGRVSLSQDFADLLRTTSALAGFETSLEK